MGKIKVISFANIKLYINDEKLGKIASGDTTEYDVEKGVHTVQAKSAWCGSKKLNVTIQSNETATVLINTFKYEMLFRLMIIAFALLFTLTKAIVFVFIAAALLLYPLYFITFGRSSYFRLEFNA